jgi:tRNA threonylcarbamoyladenosine biosynthesis protein TsaB
VKVLAVDTSTQTGSVAVLADTRLLAEVAVTSSRTHAKRLLSVIDRTLDIAGLTVGDCDGLAVTVGPGGFTGLRIGMSTVKGLAFAARKPIAAVSTLDALAHQFPAFPNLICPVLDARKEQIYTALYRSTAFLVWEKVIQDCAVEPWQWLKQIEGSCLFVGDGALVYRELINQTLGRRAYFAPAYLNTIRASVVAYIGMQQILKGEIADVETLAPYYLRKSEAEIKLGAAVDY